MPDFVDVAASLAMQSPTRVRVINPKASTRQSPDAKAFRGVAFATSAITTITDSGAHDFIHNGLRYTFHCTRTFEAYRIQQAFPRSRTPGLNGDQDYPELGVRIHCNETLCSIFPLDGAEIKPGERYVHFLLRYNTREMLVSVSLAIRPVTRPSIADYTRNVKVDAALAVFRTRVDSAHEELANEIRRIIEIEVTNAKAGKA